MIGILGVESLGFLTIFRRKHRIEKNPTSGGEAMPTRDSDLIDTNILVYSIDPKDSRKHHIAKSLLTSIPDNDLVIPIQSIQEFCDIAIRKLKVTPENLERVVRLLLESRLAPVTETAIRAH
ncbi:hypothetical protein EON79_03600 [bacterium]|nr:MAG: hypothetical protein EON79_03600 [bacterium]